MVENAKCACGCGELVVRSSTSGRIPRYASPACRVRASRARHSTDLEPLPGAPVAVTVQSHRPDDQVARAILDARAVAYALTRLSRQVRPEFAWRCERLGTAILSALADTFPETER